MPANTNRRTREATVSRDKTPPPAKPASRGPRRDPLMRAALRLHAVLSVSAGCRGNRGGGASSLAGQVVDGVVPVQRCIRRLSVARNRGWGLAAVRTEEELWGHLRRIGTALQSATLPAHAPQAAPHPAVLLAELRQLEQEFDGVGVRSDPDRAGMVIAAETGPLTLEGVYLGPFSVRLRVDLLKAGRCDAGCFAVVALDPHPASCSPETTHPHVRDKALCAGEAAAAIEAALEEGRVCDAFLLVRSVLSTYNAASPYVRLEEWEGAECGDCGGVFDAERLYGCGHCGGDFCDGCSGSCDGCDEGCCDGCLTAVGDDRLCPGCAGTCQRCGYSAAKSALRAGEGLCADCVAEDEDEAEEASDETAEGTAEATPEETEDAPEQLVHEELCNYLNLKET